MGQVVTEDAPLQHSGWSFVHLDSFGLDPNPLTFQLPLCKFHQDDHAPRLAPGKHQPNSNVNQLATSDDPLSTAPNPRLIAFNLRPLRHQPLSSQGKA
jgi:hypothetical protein